MKDMTEEESNKLKFAVVVIGLAICVVGSVGQWLASNGYLGG